MNPDKPGYATTEFWLALLPMLLPVIGLVGGLVAKPTLAAAIEAHIGEISIALAAIGAAYAWARTHLKTTAIRAQVATPQAPSAEPAPPVPAGASDPYPAADPIAPAPADPPAAPVVPLPA